MIEFWMLLALLVLMPHMFFTGFAIGQYYIKSYVDLQADKSHLEFIEESMDAYRTSPHRPISAEELESIDWDSWEEKSNADD